jgi:hypothetical protein
MSKDHSIYSVGWQRTGHIMTVQSKLNTAKISKVHLRPLVEQEGFAQ